jgi:hypothetical protein
MPLRDLRKPADHFPAQPLPSPHTASSLATPLKDLVNRDRDRIEGNGVRTGGGGGRKPVARDLGPKNLGCSC